MSDFSGTPELPEATTDPDDAELADGPSAADLALAERARNRRTRLGDAPRRAIITVLILAAIGGIGLTGMMAVTGTGDTSDAIPDSVDRLIPASGSEVLRQSQVGIDVAEGHDAYLQINGITVKTPEDGLIKDLGTGQIQVQPGPDQAVETLNQGQNCVTAFVWDQLEGESTAETVAWCFDAT